MVRSIKSVAEARAKLPAAGLQGVKRSSPPDTDTAAAGDEPALKIQKVVEKQLSTAKEAPPGACIPYVDVTGRQFGFKIPAPEPIASRAYELPRFIQLFAANPSVAIPKWSRYLAAKSAADADVIVTNNLQEDFFSVPALEARLWGRRLADMDWVRSKMKKGTCLAFATALQTHLRLYLHESFNSTFPAHQAALQGGCAKFSETSQRKRCLQVFVGEMPEKPQNPRLTYQVVSKESVLQSNFAGKASQLLDLQGLFSRLTEVQRC